MTGERVGRRARLRHVAAVATVALVLAEVTLLRHDVVSAARVIGHARPAWTLAAVLSTLVSMGCFARVQRRMLRAAGTRVAIAPMLGMVYVANAVNITLPAGSALSAGYLMRRFTARGASASAAGFAVVASGVLSSATFAGLVVACGSLAGRGSYAYGALTIVLAAIVVAILRLLRRPVLAMRLVDRCLVRCNRVARQDPARGVAAAHRFIAEVALIHPRRGDWLVGAGLAMGNWLADFGCLEASCRAVGLRDASALLIMGAYLAGMAASSISLLPGGFGVVDIAMILALSGDHVSSRVATAAVLLYRLISCLFVVVVGWVAWFVTWRASAAESSPRGQALADMLPKPRFLL